MCGLTGLYSTDPKILCNIQKMTERISHRGPDNIQTIKVHDKLSFGHTRLSIIDLSKDSNQPYTKNNKDFLIFNGEIYNYNELDPTKNSDTEVLYDGLINEGISFIEKLIGMFSFAFWDSKSNLLFLARDHIGIKPLYFHHTDSFFSFASEIKSLLVNQETHSINISSLLDYLKIGYILKPFTIYENIYQLEPGSYGIFDGTVLKHFPYKPKINKDKSLDKILESSIDYHLRSDVPISLLLSGGIDSTILAINTKKFNISYDHLNFTEKNYSEVEKVESLKETIDIAVNIHKDLEFTLKDLFKIVYHLDQPMSDPAIISNYLIYKNLKHKKVVLGGDGADELFLGYPTYLASYLFSNKLSKLFIPGLILINFFLSLFKSEGRYPLKMKIERLLKLRQYPLEMRHILWRSPLTDNYLNTTVCNTIKSNLDDLSFKHENKSDLLNSLSKLDIDYYLNDDILTKVDRLSMAFGIEARVPFLSPDLVDYALNLRQKEKFNLFTNKIPLRKYLKQKLNIKKIFSQNKVGFGPNLESILLSSEFLNYLKQEDMIFFSFIDKNKFYKLLDQSKHNYNSLYSLFNLLILKVWIDIFLNKNEYK